MRIALFAEPRRLGCTLSALHPLRPVAIIGAGQRKEQHADLARAARAVGAEFLVHPHEGDDEQHSFRIHLSRLAPALILAREYSQRLQQEDLDCAAYAAINLHAGLLPQFRGTLPQAWALASGTWKAGATLHHMTSAMDEGAILDQCSVDVSFEDSRPELERKIERCSQELLRDTLPDLLGRRAKSYPQDSSQASYYPLSATFDLSLNWTKSTRSIYNRVRAFVAPFVGCTGQWNGKSLKLDRWTSIGSLARLKYESRGGGQRYPRDGKAGMQLGRIRPLKVGTRQERNSQLHFDLTDQRGNVLARVAIHDIDWKQERAAVSIQGRDSAAPVPEAAFSFVSRLARAEFALDLEHRKGITSPISYEPESSQ